MSETSAMNGVSARLSAAMRGLLVGTSADGSEIRMPAAGAVRGAFAALAEVEAAEREADKPLRNDPLSALAIRLLVGMGQVTQEQANEAFRVACQAMEDEARRLDMTLPWVTAEKPVARESKAGQFATVSHRDTYEAALVSMQETPAMGQKGEGDDSELRQSVKAMAALLSGREWAEHLSSDDDAQQLEAQITRVIGELEGLRQQVQARGPATDEQVEQLRGLDTASRVRFYEHDFYVLSNFSAFTLCWRGRRFDTSEAAYHFEKFPDAPGVRDAILRAPSAHEAYKVAERHKAERRGDWDDVKVGVMLDILRAKASQHEYVRRKLLATGDRQLVEDSWRDDFWGWGPDRKGQNMLGQLWMQVRAEMQGEKPAPGAPEHAREVVAPAREQPRLMVRLTSFPESNGKRNWTALLVRADAWDGLVGNCGGVSLARGELWNRVAYHAECARLLIGERDTEPHILDYGDDIETPEQWAGEEHGGRSVSTAR